MKVLFDTNVLFAAFAAPGACLKLLDHCVPIHEMFCCEHILAELRKGLEKKLRYPERRAAVVEAYLRSFMNVVEPLPVDKGACRDPKDLPVLGAALAGKADCIVTGDKDLLALKNFKAISVLSPGEFWPFELARKARS